MTTEQRLLQESADARDQDANIDTHAAGEVGVIASESSVVESLKRKILDETPGPTSKKLKTYDESGIIPSIQWAGVCTNGLVPPTKRKSDTSHQARRKKAKGNDSVGTSVDGDQDTTAGPSKSTAKIRKSSQLGKLRGKYNTKPKDPSAVNPSKPRRVRQKAGAKLRRNRQVATEVPLDVWHYILSFCPPRFLGKARLISKDFHRALEYDSAWKANRLNYYGADMPGPLANMKEDEYVNLLEGRGCMGCDNKKTRKCYWIFQKRWCLTCLEKNTIKESAAKIMLASYPELLDCMPHGIVDSWGNYESAGFYERKWARRGHGRQRLYLNSLVPETLVELEKFAEGQPSEEELERWYEEKKDQTEEAMKAIQKIEDWMTNYSRERIQDTRQFKGKRAEYYQLRAGELDPPVTPELLERMSCYKRATSISKPPTERSWRTLLPKILQELAQAKAQEENAEAERERWEAYLLKMRRRLDGDTPEQKLVDELTDEVIEELVDPASSVAFEDFGILALQRIRSRYYAINRELRPDGEDGKYRLLLADAKWAWHQKICPAISNLNNSSNLAKLFKCPGCVGPRSRLRGFERHFLHLREAHASHHEDFKSLRKVGLPEICTFHWCDVEWPINLPMLAVHQEATGHWDPDDVSPYNQASSSLLSSWVDDRIASTDGPPSEQVVNNIVYAARMFIDTSLEWKYITLIALYYAVIKYQQGAGAGQQPPFYKLDDLAVALAKEGLYEVLKNVHCGICYANSRASVKRAEKVYSAAELISHFGLHPTDSWLGRLTPFPPADQVMAALEEMGKEWALKVFNDLLPKNPGGMLLDDLPQDTDWGEKVFSVDGSCGIVEPFIQELGEPLDEGPDERSDTELDSQLDDDIDESF
ncbi:hypothetical protein FGG08_005598 [Glutinoglossum americanum]|uniref:F-box domain-containing protein n=1 Tax=Glutinoglossum americanum TaxID=1670608 RepID=A0A9P8HXU7_9PEZI|nr:hypothetical protein FGG08_005598 [Glutinoglossum americanum]